MAKNVRTISKKRADKKSPESRSLSKIPATTKAVIKTVADKKASRKLIIEKAEMKQIVEEHAPTGKPVNNVKIRMYCLGTGDCFVLKFCHDLSVEFTMMIDCGSCQGGPAEFKPYIEHLAAYVSKKVDLLVITHEHNDHVNGFSKCESIFKDFSIGQAWFAWTENPEDPSGAAAELQKKRSKMKVALSNAINAMNASSRNLKKVKNDYSAGKEFDNQKAFLNGLDTLAEINLPGVAGSGQSLPGMVKIKSIIETKKVKTKYLTPGETVSIPKCKGVKFHILGPPMEREFIFKDGKEGVDVFKKKLSLNDSSLAVNSFLKMDSTSNSDLPFSAEFIVPEKDLTPLQKELVNLYNDKDSAWRKIDNDWLNSAGSLALRLNTHINNTSLAMAIEVQDSKKVLLFPGDAEYGSWESWHEIEKWKPGKGKETEKHFVEDLLNRTVFYKVGHHLSYNGTAREKGVLMMERNDLVAMATLDRTRISKGWKTTMPNKFLMQELIKRTQGKFFIMDEFEINNGPSKMLDPHTLGDTEYETELIAGTDKPIYIQYTCDIT